MAENFEQLQTRLAALHKQLANNREVTPELRTLLADLATDIERILADQAEAPSSRVGQHESLIARLSDAAREFEDSHPTLSGTIGSIIDALGQMGV